MAHGVAYFEGACFKTAPAYILNPWCRILRFATYSAHHSAISNLLHLKTLRIFAQQTAYSREPMANLDRIIRQIHKQMWYNFYTWEY